MTGTPIPAGALTVDNEPIPDGHTPLLYVIRWADGTGFKVVEADERARLLAGPPRPDGVPDGAVPLEGWWVTPESDYGATRIYCPRGLPWSWEDADMVRSGGQPVPPYQPDPDPADGSTTASASIPSPNPYASPVAAGERTGPLGLSEQDTRALAVVPEWNDPRSHHRRADNALVDACRAAVAEWDAEPQPAETLADIVAWIRSWAGAKAVRGLYADEVLALADRIEAATRPDPDDITVNRDDLRAILNVVGRVPSGNAFSNERNAYGNLCAALAAVGLPQEPTEGGES